MKGGDEAMGWNDMGRYMGKNALVSAALAASLAVGVVGLTACSAGGSDEGSNAGEGTPETSTPASSGSEGSEATAQDEDAVRAAAQPVFEEYFLHPSDQHKQEMAASADEFFKVELPNLTEDNPLVGEWTLTDIGIDPMDVVNWIYSCVMLDDPNAEGEVTFSDDGAQAKAAYLISLKDKATLYNYLDEELDTALAALQAQGSPSEDAVKACLTQTIRDAMTGALSPDAENKDYTEVVVTVQRDGNSWKADGETDSNLQSMWKSRLGLFDFTD